MPRGLMTDEIRTLMIQEGMEGTVRELRLLPYFMCCLLDNKGLEYQKICVDEKAIIIDWHQRGWIQDGHPTFKVSEEFFDKMIKILKPGYLSSVLYTETINENN